MIIKPRIDKITISFLMEISSDLDDQELSNKFLHINTAVTSYTIMVV